MSERSKQKNNQLKLNKSIIIEYINYSIIIDFEISDLGKVLYYLGIKVTRNRASKLLYISQQKFIEEILQRFSPPNRVLSVKP